MNKFYLILIVLVFTFISSDLYGQRKYLDIADEYYGLRKYREATDYYKLALEEKVVVNKPYLLQQLAETYNNLFNYKASLDYYKQLFAYKEENTSENLYNYAQLLRSEKQYEAARLVFKEYSKRSDSKGDSLYFNALIDYAINNQIEIDVAEVTKTSLEIGNRSLGLSFMPEGLIISTPDNKKYDDRTIYYNLSKVDSISSTDFGVHKELSKSFNGPYYEGTPFVYDNGTKILFSSNSEDLKRYKVKQINKFSISSDGRNILKIYSSELINEKWTDPEELSFNSNNYNCTFPHLSKDGKTLYFSSDKKGGEGGYDLWKVNKIGDSIWSIPENLGNKINTFEDEIYPYISESNFFFSSKGHYGIGGLDVFVCSLNGLKQNAPKNVGMPINSSKDDFSFILRGNEGYFSSNRLVDGNIGYDAIYSFKGYYSPLFISGVVLDHKTEEPISEITVSLFKKDTSGNWMLEEEKITNKSGAWSFEIALKEDYKIEYSSISYKTEEKIIKKEEVFNKKEVLEALKEIKMKPISTIINGVVLDGKTNKPIGGVEVRINEVTIFGERGKEVQSIKTNNDGEWEFEIDPQKNYEISFIQSDIAVDTQKYRLDNYKGSNYENREQQVEELKKVTFNNNREFDFSGTIIDIISEKPLPFVEIAFLSQENGDWRTDYMTRTNEKGEWSFNEVDILKSTKVVFSKIGFDDLEFDMLDISDSITKQKFLELINQLSMSSTHEQNDIIKINNIYFDFSSSRPKKESYPILDNVVDFMNKNKDIRIELSAHTDAVGKNDFNLELSQKRAEKCKRYLIKKGIDKSRIIPKGYGETKILNGCIEWDQCTEEENEINRRIEIKVL